MRVEMLKTYKSIPAGLVFDLPKFCVLTGKNGSGKSHLLEAIAGRDAARVSIGGTILTRIQHVGFNGLNPQVDEQCDSNQIRHNVGSLWSQIQGIQSHYRQVIANGGSFNNVVKEYLPQHGPNPSLYSLIDQVLERSEKSLDKIEEDDVFANMSFIEIAQQQNQLFFSQIAMIFKAYHARQIKNEFAEFRSKQYGKDGLKFLSQEEFFRKYGQPPWQLINEILRRAGLTYQVMPPDVGDFELPYRLRLLDEKKAVDISVNDLSSGEKVLMSLALALYNSEEGGTKPELLILDEPDAPLHPQFSKLLIDVLSETIAKNADVSVLITTHSPSTVAMAPDNSVFEIDRDSKMPKMISSQNAIEILTEGVEYLRISYEKRRQIFVESKYDAQYFQRYHAVLLRKYDFQYRPTFLEPHSGTSNCSDVISIVRKLRESGSDLVWGLIDFDQGNESKDNIVVIGGGERYAIENYILDPIYVCLALIRFNKKAFADFGVSGKSAYTDAVWLSQEECQEMVNYFLESLGLTMDAISPCLLENGMKINYPRAFLLHQGHDYERCVQDRYPELKSISRGQGDSALKLGLMQIIEEYPQFIPREITSALEALIGPKKNR